MIRGALLLAVMLTLGGCETIDATAVVDRPPLDLTLTRRCAPPVAIPKRDLSEHDVAKLWGTDRGSLADCARRFKATVGIVGKRDAAVTGRAPLPLAP